MDKILLRVALQIVFGVLQGPSLLSSRSTIKNSECFLTSIDQIGMEKLSDEKILVVGELLVDFISRENIESLANSENFVVSQGGSAANLCANLNWLGANTSFIGSVGADNLGAYLISELGVSGLNTTHITQVAKHRTSIIVVGKNTSTPDFIAYRDADMQIKPLDDSLLAGCQILHTTAFALSKQPARSEILKAVKKVVKLGGHLSVDWNFASPIWGDDDGVEVFEQINKENTLLKISMDDLERFTGKKLSRGEATSWLNRLKTKVICLTCGKDGVWFKTNDTNWQHKPALTPKVTLGVTGAGDAFWAGFLSQLLKKQTINQCIDYALMTAKQKIEQPYPLYKLLL